MANIPVGMDASQVDADPQLLMRIIQAQANIANLGIDLGGVIALVADSVRELTNADGAFVELAEGEDMVYRAASGASTSLLGLRLPRRGSLSGLCVETGETLECEDSEADNRVDREACRKVGLRSMVVVPLKHAGASVGVLKISSVQVARFTGNDIRIMELMSQMVAAAMYHAERYQADALYHLATHDPLTGLANRALFYDRLRQSLALAKRNGARSAIVNLDLDGLKPINDRFGHRAGDAAIKEVGTRVLGNARSSDTVARVGGDEFGVVLAEVLDRASLNKLTDRIAQEVARPFAFENQAITLGTSIGSALFPDDGQEPEILIETADQSMYRMKAARKAPGGASKIGPL